MPRPRRLSRLPRGRVALIAAVVVLVLALATYALYFSSWLVVKTVEVDGTGTLTPAAVLAAAQVDVGEPLARVDTGAIADRVAGLAPVAAVDLHRGWPSTLVITVTERQPALVISGQDGLVVYDLAGVAYLTPASPPAGVPVLRTTGPAPEPEIVTSVLAVVADLPTAVSSRLTEIAAPTLDSIELHLTAGVVVEWGAADDNARKAQVLTELMDHPASVYNVSAPDVPAIRPLPTPES